MPYDFSVDCRREICARLKIKHKTLSQTNIIKLIGDWNRYHKLPKENRYKSLKVSRKIVILFVVPARLPDIQAEQMQPVLDSIPVHKLIGKRICKTVAFVKDKQKKNWHELAYMLPPSNFEFNVTTIAPIQTITNTCANSGPPS